MSTNPELSNNDHESEEIAESSLDQMASQFDKTSAEEARAKRITEYKAAHPDAVEDIEKARIMAEAGDKRRTEAVNARRQARRAMTIAEQYGRRDPRRADAVARMDNYIRTEKNLNQQAEDFEAAAGSRYEDAKFDAFLADLAARRAEHPPKDDENFDSNLPEYMRPENKDQYDRALKAIDPVIVKRISDTLFALFQLVGQQEYELIVHSINNNILEGKYENAKLDSGLGGMITGVKK